jgi:hypothetical protein
MIKGAGQMSLSRQEEMEERKSVLRNEQRLRNPGTTFSQFAESEATEARGRFTAHEQSRVIGSEPLPRYPQLPASSPWAGPDLVPTEPALGYAIDAQEPLGPPSSPVAQGNSGDPDAPPITASSSSGLVSSAGRRPFFRRF